LNAEEVSHSRRKRAGYKECRGVFDISLGPGRSGDRQRLAKENVLPSKKCSSRCNALAISGGGRAAVRLHRLVYARHGRGLMGWKSPVGGPPSTMLTPTTSSRQGPTREGRSEGSRRQSCEPRNTNAIEGRHPRGESAQRDKALWSGGGGKWRGCAGKAHVLIRGDLLGMRPAAMGAGLRPRPKGLEVPPDPTAVPAAPAGAIRSVIEQKSAEAIVGAGDPEVAAPKGRTRGIKEEP